MQYGNRKVVSYIYTYTSKDITDITERFDTGKSQIYSILGYPRNSCGKFKIFCKFQKIRNLQEILTVPCIFWEYIKYSWALRSHDSHNPRSCDLSAPEYLKYSRKMHGTVKISYGFLIFWNLQNILNFPQLFLGYLRIEYNWLFPVLKVCGGGREGGKGY